MLPEEITMECHLIGEVFNEALLEGHSLNIILMWLYHLWIKIATFLSLSLTWRKSLMLSYQLSHTIPLHLL